MKTIPAEIVICGAGIAGVSAAYHLAVKKGIKNVILVDEREPLTLTSDKSTECYRNWWPGPGDDMVRFMNRSIDLLEGLAEESNNYFQLNRRGYVFLTGRPDVAEQYQQTAAEISALGAGPVRIHRGEPHDPVFQRSSTEGFADHPTGADLILDPEMIHELFPFITQDAIAMLHPRRCGWLSAQQLGMYLLRQAELKGAVLLRGKITAVEVKNGMVKGVRVATQDGEREISTRMYVIAAGPYLQESGLQIGIDLPVYNELHGKLSFRDPLKIIPRWLPLMLWDDPLYLPWTGEERDELASYQDTQWLLEKMPAGVHFRPEGGEDSPIVLALWTYDLKPHDLVLPPQFDPLYPEIILRGLTRFVPGLSAYIGKLRGAVMDGGYYCKTQENRPLIGPLPVDGTFVFGALSGFGVMAAMAGGELLATYVVSDEPPDYAPAFSLSRYKDPAYQELLLTWDSSSGQL